MQDQIFSDGIGAISVVSGTVRLDFVALSPTERDTNGQPKAVFSQRVVMSLEGFLRSAGKVHEAAQAIAKANERPGRTNSIEAKDGRPGQDSSATRTVEEGPRDPDGKRPLPFP